jgi:hypothetical protein
MKRGKCLQLQDAGLGARTRAWIQMSGIQRRTLPAIMCIHCMIVFKLNKVPLS